MIRTCLGQRRGGLLHALQRCETQRHVAVVLEEGPRHGCRTGGIDGTGSSRQKHSKQEYEKTGNPFHDSVGSSRCILKFRKAKTMAISGVMKQKMAKGK